jgi:hypothetical protein
MTVRLRLGGGAPAPGGRRSFIYKHRSFRSAPLAADRLIAALTLALLLTVVSVYQASTLVDFHQRVCGFMLETFRIPAPSWQSASVFPGWISAAVPVLSVPRFEEIADGARLIPVLAIVVLLIVSRYFGLTRNFAGFLILLLVISTFACAFKPDFSVSTAEFATAWLQVEMLLGLLLPWLTCLIFTAMQPDAFRGALWVLAIQVYGLLFSAFRLAFCVTVLHFTGMLFYALLWFALGLLATLLYLLAFYSLSVYHSAGHLWGARAQWR